MLSLGAVEGPEEVSSHCLHFGLPQHLPLSSEAAKAKIKMIRMGRTYIALWGRCKMGLKVANFDKSFLCGC